MPFVVNPAFRGVAADGQSQHKTPISEAACLRKGGDIGSIPRSLFCIFVISAMSHVSRSGGEDRRTPGTRSPGFAPRTAEQDWSRERKDQLLP